MSFCRTWVQILASALALWSAMAGCLTCILVQDIRIISPIKKMIVDIKYGKMTFPT